MRDMTSGIDGARGRLAHMRNCGADDLPSSVSLLLTIEFCRRWFCIQVLGMTVKEIYQYI